MTHPLLTRAHLEAVLVATVVVNRGERQAIVERIDPARVSSAALALIDQLCDTREARLARGEILAHRHEDGCVWATTEGQRALMDRVDTVTIADLCFFSLDTLLALVNQLPSTHRPREAAWERDLAVAQETAA